MIALLALGFFIIRFAVISDNNFYLATIALNKVFRPEAVGRTLALAELNLDHDVRISGDIVMSKYACFPDFNSKSMRIKVSIVDFLNINSMDSSFENRTEFADFFDIQNYKGTREQNLKLLDLLKSQAELCRIFS